MHSICSSCPISSLDFMHIFSVYVEHYINNNNNNIVIITGMQMLINPAFQQVLIYFCVASDLPS